MSLFFRYAHYASMCRELLTPSEICDGVEDINLDDLRRKKGVETLFLDVDNTLLTYAQRDVSLQKLNWIDQVRSKGFRIFLVSNNSGRARIQRVAEQLQIEALYFAFKPFSFATRELAERYNIDFAKSAVVGDQLLTDVLMGNWLRAHTILVNPLAKRLSFIKGMQRRVDQYIIRRLDAFPDYHRDGSEVVNSRDIHEEAELV